MSQKTIFEGLEELDEKLKDNNIVIDDRTPINYIEIRENGIYFELINENFKFDLEQGANWGQINFIYVGSDE